MARPGFVLHLDRHRLEPGAGGHRGGGDRRHGAGGVALKVADVDGGGLPHIEVRGAGIGKEAGHVDVVVPHNPQQLCAGADALAVLHIDLRHGATHVGGGILGRHRLFVVGLSLGVAVLGLGLGAGGVGGVDGVKQLALRHLVAVFKGIAEDLPGDQGVHRVGVRRLQGAAGGERVRDGAPLHRGLLILRHRGGRLAPALPEKRAAGDGDHQQDGQPFALPLPEFFPAAAQAVPPGGALRRLFQNGGGL